MSKKCIDCKCGRCGVMLLWKPIYDRDNSEWVDAIDMSYLSAHKHNVLNRKFAFCRKCNNSFFKWLKRGGWE